MNEVDGKWTVSLLQLGETQEVSVSKEIQKIKQFISMIVLDQDGKLMHAAFSLDDKGKVRLYNNYEDFTILYIGLINNDSDNNDFKKDSKVNNK